jgi:hypothetical protein
MTIGDFIKKTNLSRFCPFVEGMRRYDIDDESIAFLIKKGVTWWPDASNVTTFIAREIGDKGIIELIDNGHHHLAGVLLSAIPNGQSLHKSIYEGLYKKFKQHGVDPGAFGIPGNYTDNDFTNLNALFCIDLCAGLKLDPIQAARIVVRHLVETRRPLPCQDKVMECVCATVQTPQQAHRAKLIIARGLPSEVTWVHAWMVPLGEKLGAFDS